MVASIEDSPPPRIGAFTPDHDALLHHEIDLLECLDVVEGILRRGYDVRELSGHDGASLILNSKQVGNIRSHAFQDLGCRHPGSPLSRSPSEADRNGCAVKKVVASFQNEDIADSGGRWHHASR